MKQFLQLTLTILQIFALTFSQAEARSKKTSKVTNLSGLVQSCHDGDTCRVLVNNKSLKIRFSGIDTPEIKQPEGKLAKEFTEKLILNKFVDLKCEGLSFDRLTCLVSHNGKNINEEIVKQGYAWDAPKYSKGKYKSQMLNAQSRKLGIWKSISTSPYCFRHKTSNKCSRNALYME